MALHTESRTIGNYTYEVTTLGGLAGRKLLTKLVKTLGPCLAPLLTDSDGNTKKGWSVLDADSKSVAAALVEFADRVTPELLEELAVAFGKTTLVDMGGGKAVQLTLENQDLHFAGNYGEFFRWLAFALEVNFRDFLGALPQLRAAKAPEPEVEKAT